MSDMGKWHDVNGIRICEDGFAIWINKPDLSEEKVKEIMRCIEFLNRVVNSSNDPLEWRKCG